MSRINFLPPWVETNLQPAFYDLESGTSLQQTSRMYAKVNQLVRTVNEFTDAFNELRDYVDEYFDNLDVQEEINNKLDDMSKDGSLMALIAPYVDSKVDPFEESVDNRVSIIEDKVNAATSGSPSGVYATVSALTTADPDHSKVYVVTADGKWYYYNTSTSSWTAGGTYQSSGIGDNTVGVKALDSSLTTYPKMSIINPTMSETNAYIRYLNNTFYGTLNTFATSGFILSEKIDVKANQIVQLKTEGYNGNVCIISVVETINGDDVYYPQLRDDGSNTLKVYKWRAKNDCKIVISVKASSWNGEVTIFDDFVKYNDITLPLPEQPKHHNLIIDNDIKKPNGINSTSYKIEEGDGEYPYVLDIDIDYAGGNASDGYGWGYYCLRTVTFDSISATSVTVAIDIKSKDANTKAILGCLPNKSANFNYTKDLFANSIIVNDLTTSYKRYYITVPFNSLTTLTSLQFGVIQPASANAFTAGYKIRYMGYVVNAGIAELASNPLTKQDTDYIVNYYLGEELFSSFNKFGAIGDSLSSGVCVSNAGGTTTYPNLYEYSWGQYIAKNHGMECINFSRGGLTTRTWLTSPYGLTKLQQSGNECNAYTIALGVNDANNLGVEYLGTSADINTSDPTQNADTFYGNYGKIISAVKAVQPKAKIFIMTMPETTAPYTTFNEAIREIATLFDNVYCIDLASTAYIDNFKTGFVNNQKRVGHYNAIAYREIGEIIYKIIGNYMYKNNLQFRQIEFIGTDYSYTS